MCSANKSHEETMEPMSVLRRTKDSPFRLLNILFSDNFAKDFGSIGNIASRAGLDDGTVAYNRGFWMKVEKAFIGGGGGSGSAKEEFDPLFFEDDPHIGNCGFNPSQKIPHSWKKLREIWKHINSRYKKANYDCKKSGHHQPDFYGYCNGQLDLYYLWKHLQMKPQLTDTILAQLPATAIIDSTSKVPVAKFPESDPSIMSSNHTTPKKQKENELLKSLQLIFSQEHNETEAKKVDFESTKSESVKHETIGKDCDDLRVRMAEMHKQTVEFPKDSKQQCKSILHKRLAGCMKREEQLNKLLGCDVEE